MSDNVIAYVWYSQRTFYKDIGFRPFESDENDDPPDHIIASMRQHKMQKLLPQDQFPSDIYAAKRYDADREMITHVFNIGFTVVSSECATVLRNFDLGQGELYPVRLWRQDRVTRISGEYFYLSHGNRKGTFLPEKSPDARDPHGTKELWTPSPNPVDDQLIYSPQALEGPDIWRDDRTYFGIMMSDRLVQALKDEGVADDWKLLRCPVIDPQGAV